MQKSSLKVEMSLNVMNIRWKIYSKLEFLPEYHMNKGSFFIFAFFLRTIIVIRRVSRGSVKSISYQNFSLYKNRLTFVW